MRFWSGESRRCICGTRRSRRTARRTSYWRLVRSVRRGRKVFQETVAHLGELDAARPRPGSPVGCGDHRRARAVRSVRGGGGDRRADWDVAWSRFARNGRGASAMSGSAGGCGVRWDSTGSVPSGWPRGASGWRGRHGGDPGDRTAVRAVERAAHRRGLVPAHGARRSARRARGAGQRRPPLPRARPAVARTRGRSRRI